jgi:hypothetical protein
MPVISIGIKFLTAFCNGEIVVISTGSSYIKEVGSSFSSADALTVNAVHSFVIVFVRHGYSF